MQRLTEIAHERCAAVLQPGDVAVDATAGNGHDTCFLAEQVGPDGIVFAFDVQQLAIDATARRAEERGLQNIVLCQADHADMAESIPAGYHGKVSAIMFNLGYLPGGDKTRITRSPTTRRALEESLRMLKRGGLLSVLAYTGHPGGVEETESVRTFCSDSAAEFCDVEEITACNSDASPPILFIARKRVHHE